MSGTVSSPSTVFTIAGSTSYSLAPTQMVSSDTQSSALRRHPDSRTHPPV